MDAYRRSQNGMFGIALYLVACVGLPACDVATTSPEAQDVCRTLGLCDETAPPPIAIDVLCDASAGSSCDRDTLGATLDVALHLAVERPGSRVRLWALGRDVAGTNPVGEQVAPETSRASGRSRATANERFVMTAKDFLLASIAPVLDGAPVRRSPLAEAISKIALADAGGLPRTLVVISDGREVSDLADLECARLPTEHGFRSVLAHQRVLAPASLTGIHVEVVFLTSKPIPGRGCLVNIDREVRIRGLWNAVFEGAGAASVRLSSGAPSFDSGGTVDEKDGGIQ